LTEKNDAKKQEEAAKKVTKKKFGKKRKREGDVNDEIRKLMKLSTNANSTESKEDTEFLLQDYDSCDSENEGEQEYIDKIYYASRTHSQLSQFVKEMKNSSFKDLA
jgi:hypothetical protein